MIISCLLYLPCLRGGEGDANGQGRRVCGVIVLIYEREKALMLLGIIDRCLKLPPTISEAAHWLIAW